MTKIPKLIGGVSPVSASDRGEARGTAGLPGVTAETVGVLQISRLLTSGRLDVVPLDELELARVVAEGAEILARLAASRRLVEVRQMGRPAAPAGPPRAERAKSCPETGGTCQHRDSCARGCWARHARLASEPEGRTTGLHRDSMG